MGLDWLTGTTYKEEKNFRSQKEKEIGELYNYPLSELCWMNRFEVSFNKIRIAKKKHLLFPRKT